MNITQIPNDDSLESIKIREGIIRDFYREWKEKMTVGIRRRTHEKVQYCITAIRNE